MGRTEQHYSQDAAVCSADQAYVNEHPGPRSGALQSSLLHRGARVAQLTHLEAFKAIQRYFAPAKVSIFYESRFTLRVEIELDDTSLILKKVPYGSISSRTAVRRTIMDIEARILSLSPHGMRTRRLEIPLRQHG